MPHFSWSVRGNKLPSNSLLSKGPVNSSRLGKDLLAASKVVPLSEFILLTGPRKSLKGEYKFTQR